MLQRFHCSLLLISFQRADSIVSMYSKALGASKEVQGTVMGLHYLEETTNKGDGSRFLLEMDMQLHQPRQELVRTSEYVYLKKGSSHLCHTSNFQWSQNVHVHFVVSGMCSREIMTIDINVRLVKMRSLHAVKNLGLWVKHLIYNMESVSLSLKLFKTNYSVYLRH